MDYYNIILVLIVALAAYALGHVQGRNKGYDTGFEIGRLYGKTQARSIIVMKNSHIEPWAPIDKPAKKVATKAPRKGGRK